MIDSGGMLHGGGAAAEAVESLERGCSSTQLTQSAPRGASALTNLAAPSQAEVVKAYRLRCLLRCVLRCFVFLLLFSHFWFLLISFPRCFASHQRLQGKQG